MYICFMASHHLWCDFGWFNPAFSIGFAKFAIISRDGAKSGENKDLLFVMLLHTARNDFVCSFSW